MKYIKKYMFAIIFLMTFGALAAALPVFADTTAVVSTAKAPSAWPNMGREGRGMMKPGVFGTVSAVNGNTITVAGKKGFGAAAVDTTFTVDATNAKVTKDNAASTVSSIAVGDTIMAQGTLTGTNLVATMIRDGKMPERGAGGKTAPVSPITGDGQPVVAGTVSAISGSTVTIKNKSDITYTVDASNAKIAQGPNTISLSNIAIGDMVVVQGKVDGTSITATSLIDQVNQVKKPDTPGTAGSSPAPHAGGFLGGIGSFFAHLFGF